ncbi:uncharacterized protein [Primulina huaijiensis]|uniref:uncharacterized protein n=1 Tax=Primulina huaijiensis TaxID=1492673 RepID=UPI003CC73356
MEDLDLYRIEFCGHQVTTRVTHEAFVVDGWVADNLPDEYPIAVAAKPFRNGRGLALLQICSNNSCLIYQTCHGNGGIPISLRNMLGNPNYTVVGVSMNKIRQRLSRRYNLLIANPVELRNWIHPQIRNGTIQALARRILQIRYKVPRKIRRSRWTKIGLGRRQVLYATLDAFVTHLVADSLHD